MKRKYIFPFMIIALLMAGCSVSNEPEDHHKVIKAGHDIRMETASIEQLPQFLENKPKNMKVIYKAAAQHKELLEKIPCFCGCGHSAGHKNNYDCFIHKNNQDGSVLWDNHGTKCGVCLEIAAQSMIEYKNGKSMKEIRTEIEKAYKEGYAEPTPTPPI